MPRGNILVVDDEPDLLDILEFNLSREGYAVRRASDGTTALRALAEDPPELVILDLMLPDISGTEICRRIRADPEIARVAVLMLTAKGEESDRVTGLEQGADDYVSKPFSVRELVLRVGALLRRMNRATTSADARARVGVLELDRDAHRVFVDGEERALTALELRLLLTFIERAGRVQTRENLLAHVWEMNPDLTTRTVDTHVTRLRKKLGIAGAYIETVRGVGYRFVDPRDLERG